MRASTIGSARPKQFVPTWRGSRCAMMQAAAPVSVIAQASSSGKPKRSSNGAWWRASTPAPKPKRTLVLAVELARRRREQHRRHHAEVVDDRRAAVAHALPPGVRMEAVELDDAAAGEDRRHRRERERVHVAERQRRDEAVDVGHDLGQLVQAEVPLAGAQEVAVGEAAALRPAGRARGVEQRALGAAADRLARRGAPASAPPGCGRRPRGGSCRASAPASAAAARSAAFALPAASTASAHLAVADQVCPARPGACRRGSARC